MNIRTILLGLLASALLASPAAAEFPDKPITIQAPYAPGGNIDVTARIIADKLKDVLGVAVVVDNRAGASGMIGSGAVARSAPDGYNLLVSANSMVDVPVKKPRSGFFAMATEMRLFGGNCDVVTVG